jgi:hypothetical protein
MFELDFSYKRLWWSLKLNSSIPGVSLFFVMIDIVLCNVELLFVFK